MDDPENFGTQGKISHVKKAAIEKGEKSAVTHTPNVKSQMKRLTRTRI